MLPANRPNPSGLRWVCKTCGHEMTNAPDVADHARDTGHVGARPKFPNREDKR